MFITLEGPEGSGKTSHLKPLAECLAGFGHTVYTTREPGGTSIGEQIRDVIHDLKNAEMHPRTEALLYQAARAQLVEQELRPRLAANEMVLCDRYFDSTIAYQGYGHQIIPVNDLRQIIKFATSGLTPDLTILLDLDVEVGLSRKGRQNEWNRLDAFTVDFHQRVRSGYHELVQQEPARWAVVDASRSWEQVHSSLRAVILARIEQKKS